MTDNFDAFFRGRVPALLRAAYLLTGDRHLADDLG
jgi:DNA-directed RNA polymerase specialized sigma24 family protein